VAPFVTGHTPRKANLTRNMMDGCARRDAL
jgi:hypothetical protein